MTGPKSNVEWEEWGTKDPLFGVAAWDGKEKGGPQAWTRKEFAAQGIADWNDFSNVWEQYDALLRRRVLTSVVEIGSGAGRLTYPMADDFDKVVGVDVSQGMIDEALKIGEWLKPKGDVEFRLGNGAVLPVVSSHMSPSGGVDGVFSTHVFQHLESKEDAEALWAEAYRVLKPLGTVMVHLPIRIWPAGLERLETVYRVKRWLGDLKAARARQKMVLGKGKPIMRGQSYDWDDLEYYLHELGFEDIQLRIFRLGSNEGMHSVVFARKPQA